MHKKGALSPFLDFSLMESPGKEMVMIKDKKDWQTCKMCGKAINTNQARKYKGCCSEKCLKAYKVLPEHYVKQYKKKAN